MRTVFTRRIRFDGADSDFMYFSTPSWTRGSNIRHHVTICKRTGVQSCTCEDALYRKKRGDVLEPDAKAPCKHGQRLLKTFHRIISEGLEVAIAA